MTALLTDLIAIIAGSTIGSILKKHIREDVVNGVMQGTGVCIIFIGASGVSPETGVPALIAAYSAGAFIGFSLDLEGRLERLSSAAEKKFSSGKNRIAGPGINFFIVSCAGAYTVNACFFAGTGDSSMLYTKAVLDFIVTIAMSSSLGPGVMTAVIPTAVFESGLILLSGVLSPLMSQGMITAFAAAGSLIAVLIGTNMTGFSKIRVMNFLPALILAPAVQFLIEKIQQ